ncbi:ComC/BlpC family peptide pheromone/bacteriocin [Ligilactobacillus salivarius]
MMKQDITIEKEIHLSDDELCKVIGGGWGDAFTGIFGIFGKSPTLEELNGSRTRGFSSRSCSPYGTGGTPNAC